MIYIITAGYWYYPGAGTSDWRKVFTDDPDTALLVWADWLRDDKSDNVDWAQLIEIPPTGSYRIRDNWAKKTDDL